MTTNNIILNYHRIGTCSKYNPFHSLHTISSNLFKNEIKILKKIFNIESLNNINKSNSKVNLFISFDDVSRTVLDIQPYLKENNVPFAIAPSVENTNYGYGLRDKVYFIEKYYSAEYLLNFIKTNYINIKDIIDPKKFCFYKFTKDPKLNTKVIEKEVIEPLYKAIDVNFKEKYLKREYLSWSEIHDLYESNKNITIINHGYKHYNYQSLTKEEIYEEISISSKTFEQELGIFPTYFAIPFGTYSTELFRTIFPILKEFNYEGIMWVNSAINNKGLNRCYNKNEINNYYRYSIPSTIVSSLHLFSRVLFQTIT